MDNNSIFDLATDHYVMISKRAVYIKPLYAKRLVKKGNKMVQADNTEKQLSKINWKFVGTLVKGLSKNMAMIQVREAYSK